MASGRSKSEQQRPLTAAVTAIPVSGMPEIRPGDSLPGILLAAIRGARHELACGDILVVTHKIVSKAEGRTVSLDSVRPRASAKKWAAQHGYDERVVEVALRESRRIVRQQHGVLITETRQGWICANSGVDVSNVDGGASAVLLPVDADASARRLHRALKRLTGLAIPVIVSDTFGRPWREGLVEVAIGVAGMKPFRDFRAQRDSHGYRLRVSLEAVADEIASMAGVACGKLSRRPACIVRGFEYTAGRGSARELVRPKQRDLFR